MKQIYPGFVFPPKRNARVKGPDMDHEFAEFLTELAAALEDNISPDQWTGDGELHEAAPSLEWQETEAWLPAPPASYVGSASEMAALQAAIRSGQRSENVLADLIFYRRHPERNQRPLSATEPDFARLSQEWLQIRDTMVRPLLGAASPPSGGPYAPAPPTGSPGTPSANVGSFDGKPVARWLIPYLTWARQRGWKGKLSSGYRTPEESEKVCFGICQAPTCKPPHTNCAGRGSSHSSDVKPRGAIDVSDETRFGQLMASCPYTPRIRNAMPTSDPWHFSQSGY